MNSYFHNAFKRTHQFSQSWFMLKTTQRRLFSLRPSNHVFRISVNSVINKVKLLEFPLQRFKCGSPHGILAPAFQHDIIKFVRTGVQFWHSVTQFDLLENFLVGHSCTQQQTISSRFNAWAEPDSAEHQDSRQNTGGRVGDKHGAPIKALLPVSVACRL